MPSADIWIVGAIGLSILRVWIVQEGYEGSREEVSMVMRVVEVEGSNVRTKGLYMRE